MRIPPYWLYIFFAVAGALFFLYQKAQSPLSYDFAPQFDGNDYRHIYEYFTGQMAEYQVPFPFHSRLLVPWLASLIGSGDIIADFQWVNLAFTLLSVFMLFKIWRDLGLELHWFLVGFGWLLLHWTGLLRLNAFDPITVDLPLYFFQALLLWLVLKRKFIWLLLLAPLATLQKESFIGIMVVLTLYGWYHNRKQDDGYFDLKWIILSLALSIGLLQLVQYSFAPVTAGKSAIVTLLYHAKEAIMHPLKLVRWLLAAFMAFGPFLITAIIIGVRRRHYDHRKNLLLVFSLLYVLYGILAGGDMTRIIFLGFPFIMTGIMYELKDISIKQLLILTLLALPLTSLWSVIPDPAFEWSLWKNWYPEFAEASKLMYLGIYLAICTLVAVTQRRKVLS